MTASTVAGRTVTPMSATRSKFRVAAERFDRLPFSPSNVGRRAVDTFHQRRAIRAAGDPEWAGIEARHHAGDSRYATLLSDDLTWADFDRQSSIAERVTPDPWWLPAARVLSGWELARAVKLVRYARQRVGRGWSDSDAWNVGFHLAEITADMLDHLAENMHGWPGNDEFPTPEDWAAALRENAAKLRRYLNDPLVEAATNEWLALQGAGDPAAGGAFNRVQAAEEAKDACGREAMTWVAEHLRNLWD